MKTSLRITLAGLLLLLTSSGSMATVKIDSRRVYNPASNSCIESFKGKIPAANEFKNVFSSAEIQAVEKIVRDWMYGPQSPFYLKDFDSTKFHWQFTENNKYEKNKMGVVIIIPQNNIGEDFYSELGGGLEIPGTRCFGVEWAWLNDGEILSFVVNKENQVVEEFVNWRFEQEHPDFNPLFAYYSQMKVNYKKSADSKSVKLIHFVNAEFRGEISTNENEQILFPKGKISTLVFYLNGSIKGVMCFDMSEISPVCPMHYESTVYLSKRLGYEKVLYAKPRCEGIYAFSILDKPEFENLTMLNWADLLDLHESIAAN